jgi:hypothetical protein
MEQIEERWGSNIYDSIKIMMVPDRGIPLSGLRRNVGGAYSALEGPGGLLA